MSYSVLRNGKVIMSNFSSQQEAQKYVDKQCEGFFGIDEAKKREYEIRDDGGCYLTTATVDFMGLADDCEELTILRKFRDTYLQLSIQGKKDIEHYYSVAPKIVAAINHSESKNKILNDLYNNLILGCIKLIKSGNLDGAYKKYKDYTLTLEKKILDK
ncbi:hypothetical protein SGODD07_01612 [Streptococcus gordonii]|uniref:Uncharacterized protein n=1 Tax=Streptococcus gordonii TaxID=1302 RepID=A0A139N2J1_STRGN|nr:hypothetical protein SGODD07_01612 [Streptococcus gordonii]